MHRMNYIPKERGFLCCTTHLFVTTRRRGEKDDDGGTTGDQEFIFSSYYHHITNNNRILVHEDNQHGRFAQKLRKKVKKNETGPIFLFPHASSVRQNRDERDKKESSRADKRGEIQIQSPVFGVHQLFEDPLVRLRGPVKVVVSVTQGVELAVRHGANLAALLHPFGRARSLVTHAFGRLKAQTRLHTCFLTGGKRLKNRRVKVKADLKRGV